MSLSKQCWGNVTLTLCRSKGKKVIDSPSPELSESVSFNGLGVSGLADFKVQLRGAKPLAIWGVRGIKVTQLKSSVESALRKSKNGALPNSVEAGAEIVVVQYSMKDVDDRLDLIYTSRNEDGDALSTPSLADADMTALEAQSANAFDEEFIAKFGLGETAVGLTNFARASFSAVLGELCPHVCIYLLLYVWVRTLCTCAVDVFATHRDCGLIFGVRFVCARFHLVDQKGGHGFFYGTSKIVNKNSNTEHETQPGPLYSGTPCRPFFPRGFLWDEGFHQLIVTAFSPSITLDVLAHWYVACLFLCACWHSMAWVPRVYHTQCQLCCRHRGAMCNILTRSVWAHHAIIRRSILTEFPACLCFQLLCTELN